MAEYESQKQNTATRRHEACNFVCVKQNYIKPVIIRREIYRRYGREEKNRVPAGTKFLNTRSYTVVTKIPGNRVNVGAFDNPDLVQLTATNFQSHIN